MKQCTCDDLCKMCLDALLDFLEPPDKKHANP